MNFNPGFNIDVDFDSMNFIYNEGAFGPKVEKRHIDAIRKSLMDPKCQGPEIVYSIAMDIGREEDKEDLVNRNLLYGAVVYAKGALGKEPIRSQGHIHAISESCNQSTPEIYEIWSGKAYIYMQETAKNNPGRCFAVEGNVGDIIVVPPGWAHATISADPEQPLAFGAWCVRDFGFDYEDVRAHKGLTYFPVVEDGQIAWKKNENYSDSKLIVKNPSSYESLGIQNDKPIYTQYLENKDMFDFVKDPKLKEEAFKNFTP